MLIADTNFLIYLTKYKLWHSLENYPKLIILPEVVAELDEIAKHARKAKDRFVASVTLQYIKKLKGKLQKKKGNVDKVLLKLAKRLGHKKDVKIATQDKLLAKQLKLQGIKIIQVRQKKYLVET